MTATPSTAAQASTSITIEAATKAFEDWENAYRANPDGFYTAEETAVLDVASVSEGRAIHFLALLRNTA